jgi:uncharacterized protein (TIGR03086 family)
MTDVAERYRKVAAGFSRRVAAVPETGWDAPTPCDGWVARDIVRHLAEWMPPMFLGGAGVDVGVIPSADDDPAATWAAVDRALQAALDDPDVAAREIDMGMGAQSLRDAFSQFGLPDVLVHTWDLARATGLDDTLDPDEAAAYAVGMEGLGDALEKSGHFGPRVPVPDDADPQTRLLAAMGRRR